MNVRALFIATIYLFSVDVFAAITITAVSSDETKVYVKSLTPIHAEKGDFLEIGSQCPLEVLAVQGNSAILATTTCGTPELLVAGSVVVNPLAATKPHSSTKDESMVESTNRARVSGSANQSIVPVSRGLRVSLVKSYFDVKRETPSGSRESEANQEFGLALGYTSLTVSETGPLFNLVYSQFDNKISSLRVEASGAYSVNTHMYFFAGLNLHKFTKGEQLTGLKVVPGYQFGLGLQFTPNYGLQFSYVKANNGNDLVQDFSMSGVELALSATFE